MNKELFEEYPDTMTVYQTAEALNLSNSYVFKMAREGIMPFRQFGRKYRISKKKLIEYLETTE